jgi:hypothetical protein
MTMTMRMMMMMMMRSLTNFDTQGMFMRDLGEIGDEEFAWKKTR